MLPRELLPQIDESEIDNFKKYCEGKGIRAKYVRLSPKKIYPSQKKLNKSKIKNMLEKDYLNGVFVVSRDNRLLDGHHRWASDLIKRPDSQLTCLKVDCPMEQLISIGHMFDGSTIKTLK